MENMTENKMIVNTSLETPNGLAVDWIADNLYWTDNEYKVLTYCLFYFNNQLGLLIPFRCILS